MSQRALEHPQLVEAWKKAIEQGLADEFCDRIIYTRDLPLGLIYDIFTPTKWEKKPKKLSPRERQCLSLMSFGWKGPEIARFLGISLWTVRTHTQRSKLKFGTATLAATVAEAYRQNEIR